MENVPFQSRSQILEQLNEALELSSWEKEFLLKRISYYPLGI
jgi:hypothetical protein